MSMLVQVLEKPTRSVDEKRGMQPAEEELLYPIQRAQRRRPDHRKSLLPFRYVANTTSFPTMLSNMSSFESKNV